MAQKSNPSETPWEEVDDDSLGTYREVTVYATENGCVYCGLSDERHFESVEDCEEYIDFVLDGEYPDTE